MNCTRVQDCFIDYQDGSLPADEAAQLRIHLASCPTCQREWSALQEITRKLDNLPAAEPSLRLREQFYAMLETHQREADAPSPFALARSRIDRFFAALLPAKPALQFAFSLALLLGGLLPASATSRRPRCFHRRMTPPSGNSPLCAPRSIPWASSSPTRCCNSSPPASACAACSPRWT